MISHRAYLDPSGENVNGGGDEQGGDNGYRECFAHGSSPSSPSKTKADRANLL